MSTRKTLESTRSRTADDARGAGIRTVRELPHAAVEMRRSAAKIAKATGASPRTTRRGTAIKSGKST